MYSVLRSFQDEALKGMETLEAELCNLRALISRLTDECQEKDQEVARLDADLHAMSNELHDVKCSLECALHDTAALTSERFGFLA